MTLTCSRCNQDKPESEFHIDRKQKTGRATRCKACVTATRRAKDADPNIKRCSTCRLYLDLEEHFRSGSRVYGSCRKCRNKSWVDRCRPKVRLKPLKPNALARRLREKAVSQDEWTAVLKALDVYGPGKPTGEDMLDPVDPDGSRGLCSLTICIADAIDKGAIARGALPERIGEARQLTDRRKTREAA